jgi:hypothetical protein
MTAFLPQRPPRNFVDVAAIHVCPATPWLVKGHVRDETATRRNS